MRLRFQAGRMALAAALLTCLAACGGGVYPDRDSAVVENIRVESVRILPLGGRFILADSATRILIGRFHTGYACSQVQEMGLSSASSGIPPVYRPATRVKLPAEPDCAVDSAGRDTAITHVFTPGPGWIRLAGSSGAATDSAQVIRGTMVYENVSGVLGIAGTFSKGPWTFRDSSSLAPRQVFGDSLPACRYLNHASFSKSKDTVTIRLSFVTLDSAAAPDTCHGGARPDSLVPVAYRPTP